MPMFTQFRATAICALILALPLSACRQESAEPAQPRPAPAPAAAYGAQWDAFVGRFIEAHLEAHPAWAVVQGRHEYDGQLPDWSAEGLAREAARLHAAREEAMAFDTARLSDEQAYQREYVLSRLDHDLFWVEKARWPYRNPQFYLGWMNDSLDPSAYITLDYAPVNERMEAFTDYLSNIPRAAAQIRANLEMPMPLTWLQLGVDAFGGFADYFESDVPAIWEDVDDEELQARFAEANRAAIEAMRGLEAWLESHRETATDEYALGPDLFRQMLWDTERVDIPLEELEAIGRADMARNIAALTEACAEFSPGATLQDCMAKMSARKPAEGPVAAARKQLEETRAFVVYNDLVSIPGTEEALVEESPPYARSNSAYINIPGPWEENQPSIYYISPPNPDWPEDVQADYVPGESDLLFTSVHEVWPGHFLNFLHANRAEWLFGRAFVTYAFGEGWAHYTEEMMLEAGLRGADAETRIGQLSNALLRNARFLSTIGLHTQGWSVEDSERFFVDEAYQSEGTAIQQAARGTYDPAYLNYTMGKLLILRLRDDWVADRGGRDAWREFHDAFLSYGGPPIPLVRQQMLGTGRPSAAFPAFTGRPAATGERVWVCDDGRQVTTVKDGDDLVLNLSGESLRLERTPSETGVRHQAGDVSFWSQGGESRLEIAGTPFNCMRDPLPAAET